MIKIVSNLYIYKIILKSNHILTFKCLTIYLIGLIDFISYLNDYSFIDISLKF